MDTDLMWFAVRMWDLRITDLMQGQVYGIETPESVITNKLSPESSSLSPVDSPQTSIQSPENTPNSSLLTPHSNLNTIFNYDEIFGTIINRFIVQAIVDYPLTVYGKGGQTRGYLNINDTLQCVHKAELTSAKKGELRILNQIMETFSANELAEKVQQVGTKLGYNVKIDHLENPRKEAEEHYYNPTYQGLVDIGVEPHYLTDEVLEGMFKVVEQYKDNIRKDVIFRGIKW
jgi:UDP-sulfoquinovose synthase